MTTTKKCIGHKRRNAKWRHYENGKATNELFCDWCHGGETCDKPYVSAANRAKAKARKAK